MINENMLYDDFYPLNNGLKIRNRTVKEVIEYSEELYYSLINIFLIYPVDLIVELYDMGFPDFEIFSRYDIFIMLYRINQEVYSEQMKFLLGDVNLLISKNESGEAILYDAEKDIVFDLTSYMVMSAYIRKVHNIPEDASKMAHKSKSLKRVLIETERIRKDYEAKQRENDRLTQKSSLLLPKMLTKLTVATQFRRKDLTDMRLYEFYNTWDEAIKFNYWKNTMIGVYTGSIDMKKINKKELSWFDK